MGRRAILAPAMTVALAACTHGARSERPPVTTAPPRASAPAPALPPGAAPKAAPEAARPTPPSWWDDEATACPAGARLRTRDLEHDRALWCELADGTRHGRSTEWFPGGSVHIDTFYANGVEHGMRTQFYESGVHHVVPMVDGQRHGFWASYVGCAPLTVGEYARDQRHGRWIWHAANGSVERVEEYDAGVHLRTSCEPEVAGSVFAPDAARDLAAGDAAVERRPACALYCRFNPTRCSWPGAESSAASAAVYGGADREKCHYAEVRHAP